MTDKKILVSQVMTRTPITIEENDSIQKAIQILREHDFDHIPVTKNDTLVGILSKSDIYSSLLRLSIETSGKTYSQATLTLTPIKEIMTSNPVRVLANQDISLASEILLQGQFHSVPVTDNNDHVIGILTAKDILNYLTDH